MRNCLITFQNSCIFAFLSREIRLGAPALGSPPRIVQWLGPRANQYTDSGFLLMLLKSHLRWFFFFLNYLFQLGLRVKVILLYARLWCLAGHATSCSTMALLMEWIVLLHPVRLYVELLSQYIRKWPYLGKGPLEMSLWPNGDIWVAPNSMVSISTEEKRNRGFAWQRKRHSKAAAICMPWKGALERLTLSAPWSWTLSFLYYKKTDLCGSSS